MTTTVRVLVAGLITATAVTAAVLSASWSDTEPASTPSPSSVPTASPLAGGQTPGTQAAYIQGRKIFPSEAIPSDFRVCAIDLATQAERCTAGESATYRLEVLAGSYQVYAVVPSFDPDYRAYYSRFVTCGLVTGCTDHSPITVTVTSGQTLQNIDAGDFYR